jgi:hypothetical protein
MFASVIGELVSIGLVFATPARCASEYTPEESLFPASITTDCGDFFIVRSALPTMHSVRVSPTRIGYSDRTECEGSALPC